MSGGFFRGTTADQDTRFSNKQAKLMKSHKFPPQLEHLVDMTKVKIEVIKPWIANRVTELIGFEDEVLINFIYTLLDGKVVNGKEIQISLTGFMERNTGKFMKELWLLLLSAQQNISGVPQQFLDAKEEETRKKQAETDRIRNEIEQKKEKEKREMEGGSFNKTDRDADNGRASNASLEQSKRQYRTSGRRSEEKESDERSGSRGRSSSPRSPQSADLSPPPRHKLSRSRSKSNSRSRSHSNERLRSRKASRSPQSRGRSISSERRDRSPTRHSISPSRRLSPRRYSSPRRRYPNSRRRSISPSRYRSPSSRRRTMQSPLRRRYRSPIRRRSPSPVQHRSSSPSRSTSRSPVRRRSPALRRRSRTPVRQRSPIYLRRRSSPVPRHQSRRSPSPRCRSPSPLRRRRFRSPLRRQSPLLSRRSISPVVRRSPSPQDLSSPSEAHQSPPSSPEGKGRSPAGSPVARIRGRDKFSPARNSSPSEDADQPIKNRRGSYSADNRLRSPESLRSSRRDSFDHNGSRRKLSPLPPPPHCFPQGSESPPVGKRGDRIEERSKGSYEPSTNIKKEKVINPESVNPPPGLGQPKVHYGNFDSSMDDPSTKHSRDTQDKNYQSRDKLKGSSGKVTREDKSSEKVADDDTGKLHNHSTSIEPKKKIESFLSERTSRLDRFETSDIKELPGKRNVTSSSRKGKEANDEDDDRIDKTNQHSLKDMKGQRQSTEMLPKLARKSDQHDNSGPANSRSDESDKEKIRGKDKRKRIKSEREEVASDDDSSSDSYIEDRKEAKRRKKAEKKIKKEERHRRREERQRRKDERRAEKRRRKLNGATAPPSDSEGNINGHSQDDERIRNQEMRSSGMVHKEADPKELEIALREKALESLREKKGTGR